jgi:hypothetical protein
MSDDHKNAPSKTNALPLSLDGLAVAAALALTLLVWLGLLKRIPW